MKHTNYHTPEAARSAAENITKVIKFLGGIPACDYTMMCDATARLSEYKDILEKDARVMEKQEASNERD